MKRLLFTLALLLLTACTFAQTINFGIKAGLNLSEEAHNVSYLGSSLLAGFNAGGIVDIGFRNFSVQPGIFYSSKGENQDSKNESLSPGPPNVLSKIKVNYIEVPVNLLYKIRVSPGIKLNFGGGPYLGYGVSETEFYNNNTSVNDSHKFVNKNPDLGINFVAGIEIKNKFIIDACYGLGFTNIDDAGDGTTSKNRVTSFSAGYLFR